MKNTLKTLLISAGLTLFATSSFAATVPSNITYEPYTYNMKLDVKKVISMSSNDNKKCEVIPAKMVYEDSAGNIKGVEYLMLGEGCSLR